MESISLDKGDIMKFIEMVHEEYLIGFGKINKTIRRDFYCKKTRTLLKSGIKSCDKCCQKIKTSKKNSLSGDKNHNTHKKKIMSKISELYIGPFVINQCLGDSRYVIKKLHSDSIIGTYHVSHMKKYEQRK